MKENSILVTGGSGYIGSVLTRRLLANGYRVRVLDVGYFGHKGLDEIRDKIELVEDDILTCKRDVFDGIDHVIHLAGFSNDPTAEYRPKENFSVNVDGTKNVVKLAKNAGVKKFLFASSCSVYYTTNPDDKEKTEGSFITPTAPYSLSKHMAEDEVLKAKDKTFAPVVFRMGTVHGLSPRMRYDLVIHTLTKDAFLDKQMILHLGGRMWRPLTDIQDISHAYTFMLEQQPEKVSGHIFNLVSTNILISDLAENIQSILKKSFDIDIDIKRQESGTARSYKVSGEKLRKHGFDNWRPIETAVCEIWNDLEKSNRDLESHEYYNIRSFEKLFPPTKLA